MEYIEIKIPVTIANDLADRTDVGAEGVNRLPNDDKKTISGVATEIRRVVHVKIADIGEPGIAGTFSDIFVCRGSSGTRYRHQCTAPSYSARERATA